jgi:hypothetical protein
VRTALKGDATKNVLNLEMNAFRVDQSAPEMESAWK